MTASIPKTGRRVVVTPENRIELREFPIRQPVPGEVLSETARTLISAGTELGNQEQRRERDYTPGYSNAGRVIAAGGYGTPVRDSVHGFAFIVRPSDSTHVFKFVVAPVYHVALFAGQLATAKFTVAPLVPHPVCALDATSML
jgi:hypothetical protein